MHKFLFLLTFLIQPNLSSASGLKNACDAMLQGAPYQDYSESQAFEVFGVIAPKSIQDLVQLVKTTKRPIAVRGAGFSMGGQTASNHGIVVDMKNLNHVAAYEPKQKSLTVEAGATWRQIQELIDKDNLSVMIMQSYNNFQVGGSLSVNAHGRYVGYGPLITSVEQIKVLLADGSIVTASPSENPDLFAGAIGGYAALGIILEAKLKLVDNRPLERKVKRFSDPNIAVAVRKMIEDFEDTVENESTAVMYNADLYPNRYDTIDALSFHESTQPLTNQTRIQPPAPQGIWANLWQSAKVSFEQLTTWGKRFRVEKIVARELARLRVVWRNFEASYDNSFLKPLADRIPGLKWLPIANRKALLQEYFIPREQLPEFVAKMKAIFLKHKVNVSNVSFRHVPMNQDSMLSWSKVDSFAVVVYYTQMYGRKRELQLGGAQEWTREMIAEVEKAGGSFYLPYQIYATRDQFQQAYPKFAEFFALKQKYDPETKFNNSLWDQYRLSEDTYHYSELLARADGRAELTAYFTNIFSINNPARFIHAIEEAMRVTAAKGRDTNDRNIYDELLKILPAYANGTVTKTVETLKALRVQQREMAQETAGALANLGVTWVHGYLEIGSPGRYVLPLKEKLKVTGPVYVMNDAFSKANWVETSFGRHIPAVATSKKILFGDYDQIRQSEIPNETLDLATMYIGLHHCPPEKLHAFVQSINRVLKVGGRFVLRDHDADDKTLVMAFMAHSTYNAGLGLPYDMELNEIRNLHPLSYWQRLLEQAGFVKVGDDVHQPGDPTGNTLMVFEKRARTPELEQEIQALVAADGPGLNLNLLPDYQRAQSNTYMTQAEWFLVDIFRELGRYTQTAPWYTFPFAKFTSLYEDVYGSVREFARREGPRDGKAFAQYDEMDKQLLSGIKVLFRTMQLAANRAAGQNSSLPLREVVYDQTVLSQFFTEYADFMTHTPWYMFPHRETLNNLTQKFRQENGAMTKPAENLVTQARYLFWAMDKAAAFVRKSLDQNEVPLTTQFLLQVEDAAKLPPEIESRWLTKDLVLAQTERYMPFTHAMKSLAGQNVRVMQVAGNEYISVLVKSNSATLPTWHVPVDPIMEYQYPDAELEGGETAHHHMLRLKVGDLPQLLHQIDEENVELVRVHDY